MIPRWWWLLLVVTVEADNVLVVVQNASFFVSPVPGATVMWSRTDVKPEPDACPVGTFAPVSSLAKCMPCTRTCGLEEYQRQKCTDRADAKCATCRPTCVSPLEYQYMDCSLEHNRVCFPTKYLNLTGSVSFNCTRPLNTSRMSPRLNQMLCSEVGPEAVCSVRITNTSLTAYTAYVSVAYVYNASYGTILQADGVQWRFWWVTHLQRSASSGGTRRRLQQEEDGDINLLEVQETISNSSQCPENYQSMGGNLQCGALPCDKGWGGGLGECVACVPGTYKANVSDTPCETCPERTYAPVSNATTCLTCASSQKITLGGTACVCDVGTYGPSCTVCPPSTYSTAYDASACQSCPVGTYAPDNASTACLSCTAGFFASAAGSSQCDACEPGLYSARARPA